MRTIEDVLELWPRTAAADWTQTSGGGWVYKDATVERPENVRDGAIVAERAVVSENSQVLENSCVFGNSQLSGNSRASGNSRIFGESRIRDRAWVTDKAWVFDGSFVYGDSRAFGCSNVSGSSRLFGNARLCGNATLSGNARLRDGDWFVSPLYIQGTVHPVWMETPTDLAIGCWVYGLAEWLAKWDKLKTLTEYTPEEIAEYRIYLEIACRRYGVAIPAANGVGEQ